MLILMIVTKIVRMGLAKMEAKSKNLEIVHKYPNVVFLVKMANFNFCGQSQFRSKGKSKIIFRILRGKAIRFFGYLLNMPMCFFGHSFTYNAITEADMRDAPSHVNMVGARSHYFLAEIFVPLYSWTIFIKKEK